MTNEVKKYLREDMIDNIYNRYTNVFVIKYDEDALINGTYFGRLLLKVKIKEGKDKSIIINDFVEFRVDRVKWKNGTICLVDPYWVKKYRETNKISVKVKILKSKVNKENNKREYYTDYEYIKMTFSQFISRRLYENYKTSEHVLLIYSNFQTRRKRVGYYKALNETSKHYLVEHDILKDIIIPKINNSIRKYKKEWNELYTQNLEHDKAKRAIDNIIKENRREETCEIIDFRMNPHSI